MSVRAEKGEGQQRKTGRSGSSGQHRGFIGAGGPPPAVSSAAAAPAVSLNRSYKKSGNVQSVQSSGNPVSQSTDAGVASSAVTARTSQNSSYVPVPTHGLNDAPALSSAKPVDISAGNSRVVPKPPSAPSAQVAADHAAPKTPAKGGGSRAFTLQFGTISPGIMNGMQIPARTSSAPPNLDEQKRDQARQETFRAVPTQPIPAVQKQPQQQSRKDMGVNTGESHPPIQTKRDMHTPIPSAPSVASLKPSAVPIGGMHMPPIHFQHQQAPLQFGGPSLQMQSQGVSASSLQMTMTLPVGNVPQVPQQIFIPGIHPHALQTQAMMHQGQGLGFSPQMGHQLAPPLGNVGIGMPAQFSQQQPGKFNGPRKTTVKITHPETHEELRLDKRTDSYSDGSSAGQRPLPSVTPQSQPIPTFTPSHQVNYFSQMQSNSYNAPPIFYPTTNLPLTSTQMTTGSQGQRYSYAVSQSGQAMPFMNQSVLHSMQSGKPGPAAVLHSIPDSMNLEGLPATATSSPVQVTLKPSVGSHAEKVGTPSVTITAPNNKAEPPVLVTTTVGKTVPSVSISTPASKGVPSVIISKPTAKAEASVTIRTPISKEELPVPINMPVSNAEAPKLLKPSGGTTASLLQREMAPISSGQQPKSASEPSATVSVKAAAPDRHSSAVPGVSSTQKTLSTSSVSSPVGDSGSVVVAEDGRKREPVQRSDSLKEHHKKTNKKDARHFHHQQIEASDLTDVRNLSSSNTIKDNRVGEICTLQLSEGSETIHASMVDSISIALLPSPTIEGTVSSEVGITEGVSVQELNVGSGLSENEASEVEPSVCFTACDLVNNGDIAKHNDPTSVFLSPQVDGSMFKYPCFYPDESLLIEARQSQEKLGMKEHGKARASNDLPLDISYAEVFLVSCTNDSLAKEKIAGVENSEIAIARDLNDGENGKHETCNEPVGISLEVDETTERLSATTSLELTPAKLTYSTDPASRNADEGKSASSDAPTNKPEVICSQEVVSTDPVISSTELTNFSGSSSSETIQKCESKAVELFNGESVMVYAPTDMPSAGSPRGKITGGRKKKRKEILSKADAAGASDLYNAYKGPEEKQEVISTLESKGSSLTVDAKYTANDVSEKDSVPGEEGLSKTELDDWENEADVSTLKLKSSENGEQVHRETKHHEEYGSEASGKKKYSRDFLLTFSAQCTDLPFGFAVGPDIAEALMSPQIGLSREPHPGPGRITDRPSGGSRADRRMGGMSDDGKWIKSTGSFGPGGDFRGDIGHAAPNMNFRSGQGVNHGVLKNPRGQQSNQFVGGILAGPMQSQASQGGSRNNIESDRWQRGTGFQRGLIPSPQTPLQVMHKAEKKYEVGKVSDEEQAKQRQLKAILNKLTPQNFEKLFAQVVEVNIDNAVTLTGVISQIFDKALMEPTFCEMYANFCFHLAGVLPDFSEDNEKITFKRLLLNKCQEEFERGEREQAEANKVEEEGEVKQSAEEREEKRLRARRRMLGNIRLIGELFKKKMLTERIMHSCITKLLGQHQNPDEEDLEALCKLMSTIGEMMDQSKAKGAIDGYFNMIQKLSINQKLSSRVRFLLRDMIDLRKNRWQVRRKVDGPKTIEEVHRDAAQERQAQTSRSNRGSGSSSSGRRGQPVDYGPRGSILTSPSSQQTGSIRNLPGRSYNQDVRLADRHQFDSRSMPLPQRHIDSDSITLGPQGGLAKGMSIRGHPLISNAPPSDMQPGTDPRRVPVGPNGISSIRKEGMPSSTPDGNSGNRVFDRSTTTPLSVVRPTSSGHNKPPEAKTLSEEELREKSLSAIREFYSAKDEQEVALCVRELNAPSYYPSMVSLWVTESFERKDLERELLAGLLVDLCKPHASLLGHMQLIQGFESVLSLLEDAITDAPKAAEFLGCIFAKAIVEDVVSFNDIGKIIHEGGEERGRLLEIGLAAEVLGSILESIRAEKGDIVLSQIRASSNVRLEDFRSPRPTKSKKLDAFL